jgi:hypothetical protein
MHATATRKADIRSIPVQQRAGAVAPASFDEAARTVDVVWTTGATVRRMDWFTGQAYDEELVISESAVDLSRLASGAAPVLDSHRGSTLASQIGVVLRASLQQGQGVASLQLSARQELAGLVQDIQQGIVRNISVGYRVQRYEIVSAANRTDGGTVPLYRATLWQPMELSFVPIPADAGSTSRAAPAEDAAPCEFVQADAPAAAGPDQARAGSPAHSPAHSPAAATAVSAAHHPATRAHSPTTESPRMTQEATPGAGTAGSQHTDTGAASVADTAAAAQVRTAAPAAAPAADVADFCVRHGAPQLAADLIRSGADMAHVRTAVQSHLAARDAAAGGHRNVHVQTVTDEFATRMSGIEQAILHRISPKTVLDDNGRSFRGMSLLEIGRNFLDAHGVNTRGMDRTTLAGKILHFRAGGMHTSGDFSTLFANVANKRLARAYDENPGTYTLWARRAPNAPDFKSINIAQLSGAPNLLQVNEHGEFKYGTMLDAGETYGVITYGRIVSLTRQAIINDDLRAFDRLVSAFGFSARRLENRLVYAQLTSNPTMGDGGALFNATAVTTAGGHANLWTTGASALQFSALVTARTGMRRMKGLAGEELNLAPSFLIAPATLEQTAYQLTSPNYTPATKAEINEFRTGGRTALEPIIEPLLDESSTSAWYLAASSSQVDTVEYCYLDGAEGPVIESEVGFDVDGVSYKCRLDFGAKAGDWRGLSKSAGA